MMQQQSLLDLFPVESRSVLLMLTAPLRWLPEWSSDVINVLMGQPPTILLIITVTVLMPLLLVMMGMWSTVIAMYTMPFRSARMTFVTALMMSWWDAGRSIWLYWTGFARLGFALVGWLLGTIKFVLLTIRNFLFGVLRSPFEALDWTSRRYFKPGVPWIAFFVLLVWCAVEATVFAFTLQPTLIDVFGGLTGYDPNPRVMAPLLWLFLFLLVAGSFACIQVLGEAVATRKWSAIVQMALVEFAVMFFEVVFLYRELIDAITPWVAQQSGGEVRLGIFSTMLLASLGWVGVRGMSWFLFGRYGTPALVAVLQRQTISQDAESSAPAPVSEAMWRSPIDALKGDVAWFQQEGRKLFELLTLPVLQLLAAALNFAVVVVQSRPAFALPFKSLDDILEMNPFAGGLAARIGKAGVETGHDPHHVPAPRNAMPRAAS